MRRIISVLAVAALLAAMLMASALPVFADPLPKQEVCHQGVDEETGETTFETIEVSGNAVDTHLAHGDTLGPCPEPEPEPEPV